jgi:hypothetical protein
VTIDRVESSGGKPMKKLKLQAQMSVDGHLAGVTGKMGWIMWEWEI